MYSCTVFVQVMVFANLFHIARNEGYVRDIKDLVVNLLVDEQLEVCVPALQCVCMCVCV